MVLGYPLVVVDPNRALADSYLRTLGRALVGLNPRWRVTVEGREHLPRDGDSEPLHEVKRSGVGGAIGPPMGCGRSSPAGTVLREGEFMSLAPGLTFHLRRRAPDGTLEGIFMSDSRDPDQTVTYLAERGAVLDNPLGVFMLMNNGTIQKASKKDKSNSIIEFTSYAYDLSSFSAQSAAPNSHRSRNWRRGPRARSSARD